MEALSRSKSSDRMDLDSFFKDIISESIQKKMKNMDYQK
jgi:hypothetical protein